MENIFATIEIFLSGSLFVGLVAELTEEKKFNFIVFFLMITCFLIGISNLK